MMIVSKGKMLFYSVLFYAFLAAIALPLHPWLALVWAAMPVIVGFGMAFRKGNYAISQKWLTLGALTFGCLFVLCAWACNPNEIQMIQGLGPIVEGIAATVTAAGSVLLPSEAAAINKANTDLQNGVNAAEATLKTYEANPGTSTLSDAQQALAAVQTNLAALEQASQVKDPATAADISNVVKVAHLTISTIKTTLAGKSAATIAAAQAPPSS